MLIEPVLPEAALNRIHLNDLYIVVRDLFKDRRRQLHKRNYKISAGFEPMFYFHKILGRGGGQVVSVLAFYSDYPCSNHAEVNNSFL